MSLCEIKPLNIFHLNDSVFPEYIKLNVNKEVSTNLTNLVSPHINNLYPAHIYSLKEEKYIDSDRRADSFKATFR